jgi:uncharacterized protein (TIGR02646 family)
MICIKKNSSDCPRVLKNSAVIQTQVDCDAFDLTPRQYTSGKKKFPNKKFYSRESVKKALLESHNDHKCCYCEQRRRLSELEVEHFRPRTAAQQSKKGKLFYPGYFWLAYTWDNLYLSCGECNGRFKNCLFPLVLHTPRARSHNDNYKNEQHLLVDPGFNKPREHIRFRIDKAYAYRGSKKGKKTIEILQLNEGNLRKAREEKTGILQSLIDLVALSEHKVDAEWQEKGNKARQQLAEAILPTGVFSSMAKDFLRYRGYL